MFIPPSFRVDDEATMFDFIDRYGFATLTSIVNGEPFASHVPLLLDRADRCLWGHLSSSNPHHTAFHSSTPTLAIFHGPHAYISPTWYVNHPAVPTWNYATVHVAGHAELTDPERTRWIVDVTVAKYEQPRAYPWPNDLPEDVRGKLLQGIVGFRLPVTRLEGKFKLGQNRQPTDQASMLAHLQQGGTAEQELAAFIVARC